MKTKSKANGRPLIYPWEKWFSQRVVTLTRGKQFTCQSHSMMIAFRQQARRRKCRVSIYVIDDGVLNIRILGRPRKVS